MASRRQLENFSEKKNIIYIPDIYEDVNPATIAYIYLALMFGLT